MPELVLRAIAATAAQLSSPQGLAIDSSSNLYIADAGNNRIRKVTSGGSISTYAGNGTAGYTGNDVPASVAELNLPTWALGHSPLNRSSRWQLCHFPPSEFLVLFFTCAGNRNRVARSEQLPPSLLMCFLITALRAALGFEVASIRALHRPSQ
jgi:hypothetical protein